MRDTNRIDRICGKLDVLWHEYPDQRFGQLILNYLIDEENMFWQDDDATELRLDSFLNKKSADEQFAIMKEIIMGHSNEEH